MKLLGIASAIAAFIMSASDVSASAAHDADREPGRCNGEMREAFRLFDKGMYNRAQAIYEDLSRRYEDSDARGWGVLCEVIGSVPGYEASMELFLEDCPHSPLKPQILYRHAMNLFDAGQYDRASAQMAKFSHKHLYRSQVDELLFKQAYCDYEKGDMELAMKGFKEVIARPKTDYTAPAEYALGYICYDRKNFNEALEWFEKSSKDDRFALMSRWYMVECHFMLQDHDYVTVHGTQLYDKVSDDRKPHLARIISESYLVLGDAENARRYYDLNAGSWISKTRTDWFYSGSVMYAVKDYKAAAECYNMVTMRTDSIGQIANYNLGYSYIQIKNKVAAMEAFRQASLVSFDEDIAEDAYFNYAKLAFDLNNDTSVFNSYLQRYSDLEKGDRINSYIAVAALYAHDYASAVEAYDRIDELDPDMVANYMKANYLRAAQLISNGSYRKAVPCLKAAAYYSDKGSRFNQLTRYWLAESYYRDDKYDQALEMFKELYNVSAMYGHAESYLLTYNIAWCCFKMADYASAIKWFDRYLNEASVKFRKEALERKADCHFISRDYKVAAKAYDNVLKDYFNVNDIYPYYQAALSYGLAHDQERKISLLANVLDASPEAEFYPEALFELGRSYALKEDDDKAFSCFRTLAEVVKDSTYVARAYIEMGSLARNQSQFNDALAYYKTVVEKMPVSGCAEDALIAIESIYQTRNEPEQYLAYIESIGKGALKSADEKETMIFNSAEQIFLSENYQKALVSLQSYLDAYPDGRYAYKADFYMAESFKSIGKIEQACDCYRKVITGGTGSFVELSMLNFANLSYRLEKWNDAFGGYSSLYGSAQLENNKFVAVAGMMRSAYKGHMWNEAVKNADRVLSDGRSDAALGVEAEYVKAKSYLATSRRDAAFEILARLASDPVTAYGAEAAYLMIQDSYDRGEFTDVESKVYAFAEIGSGQTYWLARCFVVLGDSFVERGELEQAKATFESVRDGYSPADAADDVHDSVNMRLRKLEEMMTSSADSI